MRARYGLGLSFLVACGDAALLVDTGPGPLPDPDAGAPDAQVEATSPRQLDVCDACTDAGPDAEDGGDAAIADADADAPPPIPCGVTQSCDVGEACQEGTECKEKVCTNGLCAAPAFDDGVQNGDETDVDCGGDRSGAHGCATGKRCAPGPIAATNDDHNASCASHACDTTGRCAEAPSCKPHFGGDTCGKGEVGEAGAAHESCCRSLPLTAETRLDKYEITAGRMREFVRRTNQNVAFWWTTNRARLEDELPKVNGTPVTCASLGDAQWTYAFCQIAPVADYLPVGLSLPQRTFTRCSNEDGTGCSTQTIDVGVYRQLGNATVFPDRPRPNVDSRCWIGEETWQFAHPTYWGNAEWQGHGGSGARRFGQEELDVKALNCVTQVMLAAFCAWDGGRLPTAAELGTEAWGASTWPWGASPDVTDVMPGAAGAATFPGRTERLVRMTRADGTYDAAAPLFNVTNWRPTAAFTIPDVRYTFPLVAPASWTQNDRAYMVASPGRMVNDVRVGAGDDGFRDLAANLMEVTADHRSADDANHGAFPRVRWVGGSFAGEPVTRLGHEAEGNVLTKSSQLGGRCVRPR